MGRKARFATLGIVAAAVAGGVLWFFSGGSPLLGPRQVVKAQGGGKVNVEEMSFYEGKDKIYGKIYRSADDSLKKCPAVIWCHGLGVNLDSASEWCAAIASEGFAVYAFDFRGGSPDSRSTGLSTLEMSIRTEVDDLEAVTKHIRKVRHIDGSCVFLVGESQGGLVAAMTASAHPTWYKAAVLLYPAFNIPDNGRARYPRMKDIRDTTMYGDMMLGLTYFKEMHSYNPYKKLSGFTAPVLVLHGTSDTVVPPEVGQRAAELFPYGRFETISGAGHGFSGAYRKAAAAKTIEFLKEQTEK